MAVSILRVACIAGDDRARGSPALAAAAAAVKPAQQTIALDAQSSEFDFRNNNWCSTRCRIAQGPMSVAADQAQATGLDFENSHWVFRGNVGITMEQGELTSDEADVTFAKKLLVQGDHHRQAGAVPTARRQDRRRRGAAPT